VDGVEIDSADSEHPLEFVQGKGEIISGLERELYGLHIGDSKHVQIEPIQAYGEYNPALLVNVPKSDLPASIPLFPGVILEVKGKKGNVAEGKIEHIDSDNVTLDFNHPLAGKTLNFEITILGIFPADKKERR
jgi:FKBP-type peptidyl-prolyl cis-trans isomerase 2